MPAPARRAFPTTCKFVLKKVGWRPQISFEHGLTNTIQWYKKFVKIYYNKNSSFNNLA